MGARPAFRGASGWAAGLKVIFCAFGPNRSVDLLTATPGSRHSQSADGALQTVLSGSFCVGRRVRRSVLAGVVVAAGLWHLLNVDARTEVLRPCQESHESSRWPPHSLL
jgi:hypothetical protein